MENEIRRIFEQIMEKLSVPLRLSNRCETSVYYHVENLTSTELKTCAAFIAERIEKVCAPGFPDILVDLHGSYTGISEFLAQELSPNEEPLEVISLETLERGNGHGKRIKNAQAILVNDVITTARSCLKAHSQITMMGGSILCWAALVDRTFGPGPVPIITAFTGEPVTLLSELP